MDHVTRGALQPSVPGRLWPRSGEPAPGVVCSGGGGRLPPSQSLTVSDLVALGKSSAQLQVLCSLGPTVLGAGRVQRAQRNLV